MHRLFELHKEVARLADPKRAIVLAGFFKTGKGEYGHGDVFVGLTVPQSRVIAKRYGELGLEDVARLLASKIHEQRLIALLILVEQFERGNEKIKERIFQFYLRNTRFVNNWDLVDLSAPKIVGEWVLQGTSRLRRVQDCTRLRSKNIIIVRPKWRTTFGVGIATSPRPVRRAFAPRNDSVRKVLFKLTSSKNLWQRRIAIVATFPLIRAGKFEQTLALAKKMLYDTEDLIHKAVGWMLREVGKRDKKTLEKFLDEHAHTMPRTMLRYAIERLTEKRRRKYLMK